MNDAQSRMGRAIHIYERVRDTTMAVLREELQNADEIPATTLLLGAAAGAGATIDLIEMQTGGRMSRETALGLLIRYLANGLEYPAPVPIPGAEEFDG